MPYYPPPSTGSGTADASMSPIAPTADVVVSPYYSYIVSDYLDIAGTIMLDIGTEAVYEIT